jgi:hypothetical protein
MGIKSSATSFISNKIDKGNSGHEGQLGFIYETVDGVRVGKDGEFPK